MSPKTVASLYSIRNTHADPRVAEIFAYARALGIFRTAARRAKRAVETTGARAGGTRTRRDALTRGQCTTMANHFGREPRATRAKLGNNLVLARRRGYKTGKPRDASTRLRRTRI